MNSQTRNDRLSMIKVVGLRVPQILAAADLLMAGLAKLPRRPIGPHQRERRNIPGSKS